MATNDYSDGPSRLPNKQRADNRSAISEPLVEMEDAYPVFFDSSRQVLWLHLQCNRSLDRGYREIRVSDEPVRTDKAILKRLCSPDAAGILDLVSGQTAEELETEDVRLPEEIPDWGGLEGDMTEWDG